MRRNNGCRDTGEFTCNCIRKTFDHNQGLLAEQADCRGACADNCPRAPCFLLCWEDWQNRAHTEIGTAIGYSAILLAGILAPGGRIDTIERDEGMLLKARENIKRAGLGEVIGIIAGDAKDVLKCLDKQYDMVFLDAAKGQYPQLLPDCLRLLKSGGLLVADNVLYKGMVAGNDTALEKAGQ